MTIVEAIVREVADEHFIDPDDLVGPCRSRELVDARAAAAHRLFEETDLRLWQIGQVLGGRHHSSVINLLRRPGYSGGVSDFGDDGARRDPDNQRCSKPVEYRGLR